jgi:ABC-type transport system substrate-binding protein
MTYALDGPDLMEAVALDWEKIGIKVRRVPEAFSTALPKIRARKTGRTHWVYGSPPFDEPSLGWQRCIHTKGAFYLLADGPYDEAVDTILQELDAEKRARMTQALGQKLYDAYHGVMLGTKSTSWAVSKKVHSWQTLVYVPLENNYEYVS